MGWLNTTEQANVLLLYGFRAEYRCNRCNLPIKMGEVPVVDPKGGYFPKDEKTPAFLSPRPKKTYHGTCDEIMRGKRPAFSEDEPTAGDKPKSKKSAEPKEKVKPKVAEPTSSGSVKKTALKIQEAVAAKPKSEYWTVGKCIDLFPDSSVAKKSLVRQVVRDMLADGRLIRKGHFLYPPKKARK